MTDFHRTQVMRVMSIAGLLTLSLLCGCSQQVADAVRPPNTDRALALRKALGGGAVSTGGDTQATATAEPTGWATLSGKFTMSGSAPSPVKLPVSGADAAVCAPGGKPVFSEDIVVGADGGIKDVVIFVTSKLQEGEPWVHPSAQPDTEAVVFDQKQCIFLSHVAAMKAGQTLRIVNSDPVGHNTNLQPGQNAPFNQIVAAGGSVDLKMPAAEKAPFPVSCSIHPWMSAHILVCKTGYFAVTNEKGEFEIANLPAGVELEFRVWQAKTKFLNGVDIDGQPTKKGRFKLTLAPDARKTLDVAVDSSIFN